MGLPIATDNEGGEWRLSRKHQKESTTPRHKPFDTSSTSESTLSSGDASMTTSTPKVSKGGARALPDATISPIQDQTKEQSQLQKDLAIPQITRAGRMVKPVSRFGEWDYSTSSDTTKTENESLNISKDTSSETGKRQNQSKETEKKKETAAEITDRIMREYLDISSSDKKSEPLLKEIVNRMLPSRPRAKEDKPTPKKQQEGACRDLELSPIEAEKPKPPRYEEINLDETEEFQTPMVRTPNSPVEAEKKKPPRDEKDSSDVKELIFTKPIPRYNLPPFTRPQKPIVRSDKDPAKRNLFPPLSPAKTLENIPSTTSDLILRPRITPSDNPENPLKADKGASVVFPPKRQENEPKKTQATKPVVPQPTSAPPTNVPDPPVSDKRPSRLRKKPSRFGEWDDDN